jgi:hypothetical protein
MRRLIVIGLCVVLSGAFAASAYATLCEPMPCCVNQPAELNTAPADCCGITAETNEQPQNVASKPSVKANDDGTVLPPVAQRSSVRIAATILANDSSPPPTTRERLSTLAVLLI